MGIFTSLERVMGDSGFARDWRRLGREGYANSAYGRGLTEEGLGGLRGLRELYSGRLDDPLGDVGGGIFARARGNLSDDFTRNVNAGDARLRQLATQSGGSLTPEQIAALGSESRRAAGEQLFRGENELAMFEGEMTLSELGKLFDRLENIDKTITGVGQDESTRGFQAIIQSMIGRHNRNAAIASTAAGVWGAGNNQWGGGGGR